MARFCLHNPSTPLNLTPRRGGPTTPSQQSTLLSLHFKTMGHTPCVSRPTLLCAAAALGTHTNTNEWNCWLVQRVPAERARIAHQRMDMHRRARLLAAAEVGLADSAAAEWIVVLEERLDPLDERPARRFVAEVFGDPFDASPSYPSFHALSLGAVSAMPERTHKSPEPAPDLSVNLRSLGLAE